jgi:hypothetical protein
LEKQKHREFEKQNEAIEIEKQEHEFGNQNDEIENEQQKHELENELERKNDENKIENTFMNLKRRTTNFNGKRAKTSYITANDKLQKIEWTNLANDNWRNLDKIDTKSKWLKKQTTKMELKSKQ